MAGSKGKRLLGLDAQVVSHLAYTHYPDFWKMNPNMKPFGWESLQALKKSKPFTATALEVQTFPTVSIPHSCYLKPFAIHKRLAPQ